MQKVGVKRMHSKQGRIDDIDANEDIYLVNVHRDEDMFGVNDLEGDEVIVETEVDHDVVVKTEVASKDVNLSANEVTLAQALSALKSAKPKADKVMLHKPEQSTNYNNNDSIQRFNQLLAEDPRLMGLLFMKRSKQLHQQFLLNNHHSFDDIQKLFQKAMKRVNTFVDMDTKLVEGSEVREEGSEVRAKGSEVRAKAEIAQESSSKRAGTELEQESIKKKKVDEDKEIVELQRLIEVVTDKEEVAIDAIPLATKPPSIVDYKIHKEVKKTYYQIIKADGCSKMYLVFSHMLKSFDREDLETLWKLVKAKHESTRPEVGYERMLWGDLKTMFDPHVEDQGRIVGIKRLHDDLGVTTAKPPSVVSRAPSAAAIAPVPVDTTCIPSSTLVDQDAPSVSTSQTLEDSQEPVLHQDVEVQVPLNA
ncbi:hypothetical protein Tco_0032080 [Tanacetum coccineum]